MPEKYRMSYEEYTGRGNTNSQTKNAIFRCQTEDLKFKFQVTGNPAHVDKYLEKALNVTNYDENIVVALFSNIDPKLTEFFASDDEEDE